MCPCHDMTKITFKWHRFFIFNPTQIKWHQGKYHVTTYAHKKSFFGSCVGRMVKLLACGARSPGFDSRLATWIPEIGYCLLPSHNMAEIPLKRLKSSIQPTNQLNKLFPNSNVFATRVRVWSKLNCTNVLFSYIVFSTMHAFRQFSFYHNCKIL